MTGNGYERRLFVVHPMLKNISVSGALAVKLVTVCFAPKADLRNPLLLHNLIAYEQNMFAKCYLQ